MSSCATQEKQSYNINLSLPLMREYLDKCNSTRQIDLYEFAQNLLFSPFVGYANNSPSIEHVKIVKDAIKFLKSTYSMNSTFLISSERLCDTTASLFCFSDHKKPYTDNQFPVYNLCRIIGLVEGVLPSVFVVMREPIDYLRSKYMRTVFQREEMGERFLTASEFIAKQITLEIRYPGTSALAASFHSEFLLQLQKVSFVKAIGFKELLESRDVFSMIGINGEEKYSLSDFPKENELVHHRIQSEDIKKEIENELKRQKIYSKITRCKLYE